MKKKIFCIGFNKTGTTTLNSIFKDQLGYRSAHKPKWPYWSADKRDSPIDHYDALTDGETPLINNLRRKYPDAYFILNTRPLKNWITSRHKAIERSKTVINWAFTKFIPMGIIGRYISRKYLANDDKTIIRWIRIRNSYHRFVINEFINSDKFLLINIEDDNMLDRLGTFLQVDQKLIPILKNQEGKGSLTSSLLDSIGDRKSHVNSNKKVEMFFEKHNLTKHEECITFFENEDFQLSISNADKFLSIFPVFKGIFRRLFLHFVRRRGKANSFVSKWYYDSMISFFRSEKDLNFYTSIFQMGSGAR